MTKQTIAIELTAYDDAISTEKTLCFATQGFTSKPTDDPANTHFAPAVIEAGNFSQYLINSLVTDGRSRIGVGVVTLANVGALDAMSEYGLDGREIVIRRGVIGQAYPPTWETLLTGTMEQAEFTLSRVSVRIRDRQAEVADKAYQETKYAGSNSGSPLSGVEGVAEDLKGKPKPVLYGKARNLPVPMVNSAKLTFQISHRQISSIDAVYVGGLAISAGTGHGSLDDLQGATVGAGTYDYYLGSGSDGAYFRLGTAPDNVVTCDATQGGSAADRTAAQIAQVILLAKGVDGGDIDTDSVDDLDTANDAVIGIWTGTEERRTGDVLDEVLGSVGGYWATDANGTYFFGRLEAPSGTPVLSLGDADLLESSGEAVERLSAKTDDRGLPAWRINFRYQKNYRVQDGGDVVPAVTSQERRAQLAEEWRTVISEDASVKTKHLLAPEKTVTSLIDDATAAATEAQRLRDMYKVKRDFLRVRVPPSRLAGTVLKLGDVIELDRARFDWDGGKLFRVMGITNEFGINQTTLELWG